jgi:hypothetical protein
MIIMHRSLQSEQLARDIHVPRVVVEIRHGGVVGVAPEHLFPLANLVRTVHLADIHDGQRVALLVLEGEARARRGREGRVLIGNRQRSQTDRTGSDGFVSAAALRPPPCMTR